MQVGMWISDRKDIEHVNAAWMIMPVSNFVSAFVGPMLNPMYTDWCQVSSSRQMHGESGACSHACRCNSCVP